MPDIDKKTENGKKKRVRDQPLTATVPNVASTIVGPTDVTGNVIQTETSKKKKRIGAEQLTATSSQTASTLVAPTTVNSSIETEHISKKVRFGNPQTSSPIETLMLIPPIAVLEDDPPTDTPAETEPVHQMKTTLIAPPITVLDDDNPSIDMLIQAPIKVVQKKKRTFSKKVLSSTTLPAIVLDDGTHTEAQTNHVEKKKQTSSKKSSSSIIPPATMLDNDTQTEPQGDHVEKRKQASSKKAFVSIIPPTTVLDNDAQTETQADHVEKKKQASKKAPSSIIPSGTVLDNDIQSETVHVEKKKQSSKKVPSPIMPPKNMLFSDIQTNRQTDFIIQKKRASPKASSISVPPITVQVNYTQTDAQTQADRKKQQSDNQQPPRSDKKVRAPKAKHKRALMKRFSDEVLQNILYHSLPDFMDLVYVDCRTKANISAPLIVAAVCQKWRQIAFSTPLFWTDVPAVLSELNHRSLPTLATQWIKRAGRLPLRVYFTATCPDGPDLYPDAIGTIEVLSAYSERWSSFIYDGPDSLLSSFTGSTKMALCQIDTLILHPGIGNKSMMDLWPLVLQPTGLADLLWIPPQVINNVDWARLSRLKLSLVTIADCLEILSSTSNLMECTLAPYHCRGIKYPDWPVHLLFLEHLILVDVNPLGQLLSRLNCPFLISLTLNTTRESQLGNVPVLTTFMKESHCSLQSLTLKQVGFDVEEIGCLFSTLQNLRSLHIEEADSDDIPESLSRHPDQEHVILTHLLHLLAMQKFGTNNPLYLPGLQSLVFHAAATSRFESFTQWMPYPSDDYTRLRHNVLLFDVIGRMRVSDSTTSRRLAIKPNILERFMAIKQSMKSSVVADPVEGEFVRFTAACD